MPIFKKPYILLLFPFIAMLLLTACGPNIDGSSEAKFKASFAKIQEGRSSDDTMKLNNAIRVIGVMTMGEKFSGETPYKDKSVQQIVMIKLNGKNYNGIINEAEDEMAKRKEKEITDLQKEIDDFKATTTRNRAQYDAMKKKTSILKGRLVKIDLVNGTPYAFCEFKNTSNKNLDVYTLNVVGKTLTKNELLINSTDVSSGVRNLAPNDTLLKVIEISKYDRDEATEVPWNNIKYPVTDTKQYHFKVDVYTAELMIDDKDYDLSKLNWHETDEDDYNQKLKEMTTRLDEVKKRVVKLDDM